VDACCKKLLEREQIAVQESRRLAGRLDRAGHLLRLCGAASPLALYGLICLFR
jgi:hypothetical protein